MSKYAIMLSQGSHIEKSKITKQSPVKLLEGNNSELFQKKLLKGKLIKLINQSIIRTSEPSENSSEQSLSLRTRVTKNSKKKFSINFNPNLIGNDIKFTTISHDNYVTPHELVSRNFSPNQIQLISSNPIYFKLPEDFMEIDLFKKRKLIDVLERESKNNLPVLKDYNQSNLHTKVMKNVKSNHFLYFRY